MKTVEEMYTYCLDNNLVGGTKRKLKKEFQVIKDNLIKDVEVKIVLSGINNYKGMTDND